MSAVPVAVAGVTQFDSPLEAAVIDFIAAKRAEEAAKRQRLQAEERILAMRPAREEGSETFEVGGFKVTTTGKLTYKCEDPKAVVEACAMWPANMVPVKTKLELDDTGCKWLRANEPEAWATVAKFVTVSPAKAAVKVAL